jgi:hypothetical protein
MKKLIPIIGLVAAACLNAAACNVPVFRFALERWPADAYRFTVFHRGALSADQRAVAKILRDATDEGLANIDVAMADVAGTMTGEVESLWKTQTNSELPLVIVRYPVTAGLESPAASGPLTKNFVREVLDSPARRDVWKRIAKGESIVWVLLESGDTNRDDAVAALVQKESAKLADSLEIPPVDPSDPRTEVNVTLKIAFSLVRVSRTDPAEMFFVKQLLNKQPKFIEAKGPLVFPVFGRGRVLCGLPGDELTADNVEEVATFLTGACSCQVKESMLGWDLLLNCNWDEELMRGDGNRTEAPQPKSGGQSSLQPETVTIHAKPAVPIIEQLSPKKVTLAVIAVLLALAVVLNLAYRLKRS